MSDRDERGFFTEGNLVAEKHGGEGAIKAVQHGTPFTGLAAQAEQQVKADLEAHGRPAMVQELATRLHTTARLYWAAILSVADQAKEDAKALAKLDSYVARFGWLAAASLRAWEQVRKEELPKQGELFDYDAMVEELRKRGSGS